MASWRPPEGSWVPFGRRGRSEAEFGRPLGMLGALLAALGPLRGPSGALLGHLGALLEAIFASRKTMFKLFRSLCGEPLRNYENLRIRRQYNTS